MNEDSIEDKPERKFGLVDDELFQLVRHSHIFASVVRELLEIRLLNEVTPEPLTPSQFHLLKLTVCCRTAKVGDVGQFLGVSAPAALKTVDKLERLGLVNRVPSSRDRRATELEPTAAGAELVDRYEELQEQRLGPVFDALTRDELIRLTGSLRQFSLALIEAETSVEGICLRCSAYYDEECPVGPLRGGCPYRAASETTTVRVST